MTRPENPFWTIPQPDKIQEGQPWGGDGATQTGRGLTEAIDFEEEYRIKAVEMELDISKQIEEYIQKASEIQSSIAQILQDPSYNENADLLQILEDLYSYFKASSNTSPFIIISSFIKAEHYLRNDINSLTLLHLVKTIETSFATVLYPDDQIFIYSLVQEYMDLTTRLEEIEKKYEELVKFRRLHGLDQS